MAWKKFWNLGFILAVKYQKLERERRPGILRINGLIYGAQM